MTVHAVESHLESTMLHLPCAEANFSAGLSEACMCAQLGHHSSITRRYPHCVASIKGLTKSLRTAPPEREFSIGSLLPPYDTKMPEARALCMKLMCGGIRGDGVRRGIEL